MAFLVFSSEFIVRFLRSKKSSLVVLMVIMLVNALSYGTIIPLLYPYASRFGINPLGLSFLIASFSLAQFLATPVIGRMSDRYGRKPMLLLSLFGTSISLALFASAWSVTILFLARILDGITGGNISVAQAVIADSRDGKDRAKALGMLGAAFGVGFLLGPAIGGILSRISLTAPFWFASGLALVGTIVGWFILEETLDRGASKKNIKEPLFKFGALIEALGSPVVGAILLISFLFSVAQFAWVIGFQAFSVDELSLNAFEIGIIFTIVGVINVVMQGFGIRVLLDKVEDKKRLLLGSLIFGVVVMFSFWFASNLVNFTVLVVLFGILTSPIVPVTTAILSEATRAEDQGGALGINQSYTSLGQIFGPLAAGAVSGLGVRYMFLMSAVFMVVAVAATGRLWKKAKKVDL